MSIRMRWKNLSYPYSGSRSVIRGRPRTKGTDGTRSHELCRSWQSCMPFNSAQNYVLRAPKWFVIVYFLVKWHLDLSQDTIHILVLPVNRWATSHVIWTQQALTQSPEKTWLAKKSNKISELGREVKERAVVRTEAVSWVPHGIQ
jgi:hypothetical protein